ncbi:putative carbohydrate esterase family 1 protein [Phakopsora pachyrhizi]|uniref:S-formylglutathione hydrolase n=1 Tax=Phakopsora pachyrhizi TaxID=170000 RepID=A0AAV0BJ21_PHAPC|nr:putative carbohydrate esterase family 1 protein [Phakopsora pachyrhizi]CAH7686662.1 putative carbohydrate esterase family 1 protein [Phakopsora pachyrhizi]
MGHTYELVSSSKAYGGVISKYRFKSNSLGGLETKFNLYIPESKLAEEKEHPVLYYLAGLTCNEDNGAQKGGFLKEATKYGIALVFPDTSPRGANIESEDADWDFGTGAGFYLNATHPKWSSHYNMEKLITEELPSVLSQISSSLDLSRQSIFGHSMGGHGAVTIYLNHISKYKSCSAFAPILNPTKCAWGKKAFSGPNGNDGYLVNGIEEGKKYDATEIIKNTKFLNANILIDYGDEDQFLKDGQLLPQNFRDAANGVLDLNPIIRNQSGYDHSYYFISTFAAEHIEFHSRFLAKQ